MGRAITATAAETSRRLLLAERVALNFALGMFYLFGYGFVNAANARRPADAFLDLSLPGETGLPFVPEFVWIYCAPFVLIGVAMFAGPLRDRRRFHRVVGTMTLDVALSFAMFILIPAENYYRATLPENPAAWSERLVALFYAMDRPYNCFPSMHVSLNALATYVLADLWPRARWALWTLAVLMMASIVLIKQHYVLDAAGGFALATGLYLLFLRRRTGGRAAPA